MELLANIYAMKLLSEFWKNTEIMNKKSIAKKRME